MNKHVLFAAVAATLFAAPVHAIKINDQAVTANGGNTADIQGTAPNVFNTLRTASMASQFDAVGRIGDCTGTWLGAEGEYAWVLTAARCVRNTNVVAAADHLTFTDKNGVALAGGAGSKSYIHPKRINRPSGVRDAGTDIALVRLKRLPASDTQAPVAPVIYDGKTEAGAPVAFVAYGSVFANSANVNAVWPTAGERRAWGESNLDGVNENGHALFANYSTGSALRWAGLTTSDAGSAWWQQRNGEWQIVATTSGGSTVQSHGARVSTYATWIKDLYPNVRLSSETRLPEPGFSPEITESKVFLSANQPAWVAYVKSAGQPNVIAPTATYEFGNEVGFTKMSVPLTNAATGEERMVVLRAARPLLGCGSFDMPMNNAADCGAGSRFRAWFDFSDNALLNGGTWRGQLSIDVAGTPTQFPLDIEIAMPWRRITAGQVATTGNHFGAYVGFSIPTQANATGPTSLHLAHTTSGMTTITLNAREAITQTIVPIKLRAQRNNGCADVAMNNAVHCTGQISTLKAWFDPSDNPSLQPGRYRTQFDVQARGWTDKTFSHTFRVDVDIVQMP